MTTTNNAPISFRLTDDELELLRPHQDDGEKSLNLTAKRLLLTALGVDVKKSSLQVVNSVDTNQIKELIETAVQEKLEKLTIVDNVDTIKNLIADSIASGKIGEAIAKSYFKAMDNLKSTREEIYSKLEELTQLTHDHSEIINTAEDGYNQLSQTFQGLQLQINELKDIPAPIPQSVIDDEELTNDQIPETTSPAVVLNHQSPEDRRYSKIVDWLCAQLNFGRLISDDFGSFDPITHQPCGELFDNEYLIKHNFHGQIAVRKDELELKLGIKLVGSKARVTSDVKAILAAVGFQVGKKQIKRKETYWVVNPQNEKKL